MKRFVIAAGAAVVLMSNSAFAVPSVAGQASSPKAATGSSIAARTPDISCAGDTVVWVNPRSKAYHLEGDKFFGHTKRGKFECKKAADAEGGHEVKPGK